jgi:hypothetical protein
MTIMGWWIAPAAVTVAAFAWALPMRSDEKPTGSMFDGFGYPFGVMVRLLVAIGVSLATWLAWSLLT